MKHIKEFQLNENGSFSFRDNMEKLNKCNSEEEQLKLIWMWIKQEHINLKEFIELIKTINEQWN